MKKNIHIKIHVKASFIEKKNSQWLCEQVFLRKLNLVLLNVPWDTLHQVFK